MVNWGKPFLLFETLMKLCAGESSMQNITWRQDGDGK